MQTIEFDDIRVGDKIKVVDDYARGNLEELIFTVKRVENGALSNSTFSVNRGAPPRAYRYWYLVERPETTLKVGDTITGEQVADLPDGAVFDLNECGTDLRYKIDGELFSAQGYFHSPSTYRETDYRDIKIVFLPEA